MRPSPLRLQQQTSALLTDLGGSSCRHQPARLRQQGPGGRRYLLIAGSQRNREDSSLADSTNRLDTRSTANGRPLTQQLQGWWERQQAVLLYNYFKWRRDAFSDLYAIFVLSLTLLVASTAVRALLFGEPWAEAWVEYYTAVVVAFGEAWPPANAAVPEQVGAILLYLTGLIGFAVVLSLVEQSVLQVYEARVEQGSPVLEQDHILVLTWCRSQSDVSKLEVILTQLCAAYTSSGGRTIVVLSLCRKTVMEARFLEAIPEDQRGGSRFVFRQGNPLKAADLDLVAADQATAVVVVADTAASPDASDSKVVRVLVLLDEIEMAARAEGRRRPVPGHVVAEILSEDAMPLMKFMLIKPVLPLPPHRQNAARLAMLVTRPVVSALTDTLWDFTSGTAIQVHCFPQLAGKRMADIALSFRHGIVLGLLEASTGMVLINPPQEYRYSPEEHIILLRPTFMKQSDVVPLPEPAPAPLGNFSPEVAAATQRALLSPTLVTCSHTSLSPDADQDSEPFTGPSVSSLAAAVAAASTEEYGSSTGSDGWGTQLSSSGSILDADADAAAAAVAAAGAAAAGDQMSLAQQLTQQLGRQQPEVVLQQLEKLKQLGQLEALNQPKQLEQFLIKAAAKPRRLRAGSNNTGNKSRMTQPQRKGLMSPPPPQQQQALQSVATVPAAVESLWAAGMSRATISQWEPRVEPLSVKQQAEAVQSAKRPIPTSGSGGSSIMFRYEGVSMQLDKGTPIHLLVLGWGQQEFMVQLLLALQSGSAALQPGSSITFANTHSATDTLYPAATAAAAAAAGSRISRLSSTGPSRNSSSSSSSNNNNNSSGDSVLQELLSVGQLSVRHVRGDPVKRSQLAQLDLSRIDAAIILCDKSWLTSTSSLSAAAAAGLTSQQQQQYVNGYDAERGAAASYSVGSGGVMDDQTAYLASAATNSSSSIASQLGHHNVEAAAAEAEAADVGSCVLALDALLLRVQLNLRSVLEVLDRERQVNIITENVGNEPNTRFEDKARLPFGVPFNRSSFTACLLSQLAVCPLMILPRTFGAQVDPVIVDADVYASIGDKVTFWQLMHRAQLLGHVLMGYYQLPLSSNQPIEAVLCPLGPEREELRVWNEGDHRLKFIVLQDAVVAAQVPMQEP